MREREREGESEECYLSLSFSGIFEVEEIISTKKHMPTIVR